MAASTEQKDSCHATSLLASAFYEWLLIILLFLDGVLSYLAVKLARYCKLQIPCILCSRLDHIWGNEKPGFYQDLLCSAHKLEVASLAYCNVHRMLGDVHEMCESCLLSFTKKKNSNPEACKLLVTKIAVDFDEGENILLKLPATPDGDGLRNKFYGEDLVKIPLLKKDLEAGSLCKKRCSCCSDSFRGKSYGQVLPQRRIIKADAEISNPLYGTTGDSCIDGLGKRGEKSSRSPTICHLGNHDFNLLSHVGYSELKITSDSESEVPFSDEDDGNALARGIENLKEELLDRCLKPVPATIIAKDLSPTFLDDMVREKLIHPTPIVPEPSLIAIERQLHESEYHDNNSAASNIAIGHGLEEINWGQVEVKDDPPAPSEFISEHAPVEASNAKYVPEIGDSAYISSTSNGEVTKALNPADINTKTNEIMDDRAPSVHINMDLTDANKLLAIKKTSSPPPIYAEVVAGKESTRVHEDLRLLLSQISSSRGLELPWNEMSPSPRLSDASSTTGSQSNSKRLSVEANESSLESLYGIVSEVEGESAVDRLKRQVDLDRKSMTILFKELEEERSASAISANQAMAMINRLQEEKAAMQMEALQYQRMMEEQAEYDQEALEKLNDLLAEREKEIQDMEAEVDAYKKRAGEESMADSMERDYSHTSTPRVTRSASRQNSYRLLEAGRTGSRLMKDSLMDIEDEKTYISECLKRLEKKLQMFPTDGEDGFPPNEDSIPGLNYEHGNGVVEQHSEELVEGNDVGSEKKDATLSREDSNSIPPSQGNAKENHKDRRLCYSSSNNNMPFPIIGKTCDVIVLGDEISQLSERLEALEADREFLDRSINSLKNGNDGIQFIREIACHLRELRRIGIRLRKHMVA